MVAAKVRSSCVLLHPCPTVKSSATSTHLPADCTSGVKVNLGLYPHLGIFGHRGAGCSVVGGESIVPENSFEAFERAVECGVKGIEIDVWLTNDNEVVVIHGGGEDTDGFLHETVIADSQSNLDATSAVNVPLAALSSTVPSPPSSLGLEDESTYALAVAGTGVSADKLRARRRRRGRNESFLQSSSSVFGGSNSNSSAASIAPGANSQAFDECAGNTLRVRSQSNKLSTSHELDAETEKAPMAATIASPPNARIEKMNYNDMSRAGLLKHRRPWPQFEESTNGSNYRRMRSSGEAAISPPSSGSPVASSNFGVLSSAPVTIPPRLSRSPSASSSGSGAANGENRCRRSILNPIDYLDARVDYLQDKTPHFVSEKHHQNADPAPTTKSGSFFQHKQVDQATKTKNSGSKGSIPEVRSPLVSQVPLLRDVLKRFHGRLKINVELKGTNPRLGAKCLELAREYPGTVARFSSFLWDTKTIAESRKLGENTPCGTTEVRHNATAINCEPGDGEIAAAVKPSTESVSGGVPEISSPPPGGSSAVAATTVKEVKTPPYKTPCKIHPHRVACREECSKLWEEDGALLCAFEKEALSVAPVAQVTTPADVLGWPNGPVPHDLMRPLVSNELGIDLALLYGGYRLPAITEMLTQLDDYQAAWIHVPIGFGFANSEDRNQARKLHSALLQNSRVQELLAAFPTAAEIRQHSERLRAEKDAEVEFKKQIRAFKNRSMSAKQQNECGTQLNKSPTGMPRAEGIATPRNEWQELSSAWYSFCNSPEGAAALRGALPSGLGPDSKVYNVHDHRAYFSKKELIQMDPPPLDEEEDGGNGSQAFDGAAGPMRLTRTALEIHNAMYACGALDGQRPDITPPLTLESTAGTLVNAAVSYYKCASEAQKQLDSTALSTQVGDEVLATTRSPADLAHGVPVLDPLSHFAQILGEDAGNCPDDDGDSYGEDIEVELGPSRETILLETVNLLHLVRVMRAHNKKTLIYGLHAFEHPAKLELSLLTGVEGLCPNDIQTVKKLTEAYGIID